MSRAVLVYGGGHNMSSTKAKQQIRKIGHSKQLTKSVNRYVRERGLYV